MWFNTHGLIFLKFLSLVSFTCDYRKGIKHIQVLKDFSAEENLALDQNNPLVIVVK